MLNQRTLIKLGLASAALVALLSVASSYLFTGPEKLLDLRQVDVSAIYLNGISLHDSAKSVREHLGNSVEVISMGTSMKSISSPGCSVLVQEDKVVYVSSENLTIAAESVPPRIRWNDFAQRYGIPDLTLGPIEVYGIPEIQLTVRGGGRITVYLSRGEILGYNIQSVARD